MEGSVSESGMDPTTPLQVFQNLTVPTGGDSKLENLNVYYNVGSRARRACVTLILTPAGWRYRVDAHVNGLSPAHDPRCRLFLLWSRTQEVCIVAAMVVSVPTVTYLWYRS